MILLYNEQNWYFVLRSLIQNISIRPWKSKY